MQVSKLNPLLSSSVPIGLPPYINDTYIFKVVNCLFMSEYPFCILVNLNTTKIQPNDMGLGTQILLSGQRADGLFILAKPYLLLCPFLFPLIIWWM